MNTKINPTLILQNKTYKNKKVCCLFVCFLGGFYSNSTKANVSGFSPCRPASSTPPFMSCWRQLQFHRHLGIPHMPQKPIYTPSNVHVSLFQIFHDFKILFQILYKTKGNRHEVYYLYTYSPNEYNKTRLSQSKEYRLNTVLHLFAKNCNLTRSNNSMTIIK